MDTIIDPSPKAQVQTKHLVYLGFANIALILGLGFQAGIRDQRLAAVEQLARDNAGAIHAIQEAGTPAYRVWTETVSGQLHDIQTRLDRIERQVK